MIRGALVCDRHGVVGFIEHSTWSGDPLVPSLDEQLGGAEVTCLPGRHYLVAVTNDHP